MANKRGLAIECVEDGFDQQQIDAAIEQAPHAFHIAGHQFIEADIAEARVVDVRGNRCRATGGPQHARDKTRLVRRLRGEFLGGRARQSGARAVEFVHQLGHAVVGHRHGIRIEGIGLDNIRARLQVGGMDAANDLRLGQRQQVVVALLVAMVGVEAVAVIVCASSPWPWIMVPMAPSRTRMRSLSRWCSSSVRLVMPVRKQKTRPQ